MDNLFNHWACKLQLQYDGRVSPTRKNVILRSLAEMVRKLPDDARLVMTECGEVVCYSGGQLHEISIEQKDDDLVFKCLEAASVKEISDDDIAEYLHAEVVTLQMNKGGFVVTGYMEDEESRVGVYYQVYDTYPEAYRACKTISEVHNIPMEDHVFNRYFSR